MNHLVKFPEGHESGQEQPGWHLKTTLASGEFTACGLSYVDGYKIEEKSSERGGITCEQCLDTVRFFKTIKL